MSLPVEGLSFGTFYKQPDETHCSHFSMHSQLSTARFIAEFR
jgi:hypothetical protein